MGDRNIEDVDLLVVVGGKAGKSLAMDRAKAGWNVVMVERDKIGGTCINVACIPTKALVASARTLLHDTVGNWKAVVDASTDRVLGAGVGIADRRQADDAAVESMASVDRRLGWSEH